MTGRARVVVVGGGVAGLVAARALARRCDVVLLEADGHPGGKLRTGELLGRPLDLGPDAFITRNGAAAQLCRQLGLEDELTPPASGSAAVFARGRLRPLPAGLALGVPTDLVALWRSGIVKRSAVLRAAADLVLPGLAAPAGLIELATAGTADPTVAAVVGGRLGTAVLDALVDPLLGGINASDVRALSFAAAAPQLAERAAGRHSLLRALRATGQKAANPAAAGTADPPGTADAARPDPLFLGLRGGLGLLVERLVAACEDGGVEIVTALAAEHLARAGDPGWRVHAGARAFDADGLVLALPAYGAAGLLAEADPELASECGAIPYASVATVALAWAESAVPPALSGQLAALVGRVGGRGGEEGSAAVLPGNGVLVPRSSRHLVTAATFTSTKWPGSAPPGQVVVRASAGRHGDDRAAGLHDGALVARVRSDLREILGIGDLPLASVVARWPRAFPQYVSGHLARVARIEKLVRAHPALTLAGAAFDGIGIPACVASGERAADSVAAALER